MESTPRSIPSTKIPSTKTKTVHRRAVCLVNILDAAHNDEFIALFNLVDAARLAVPGLRGIHLPLIVKDRKSLDFARLTKRENFSDVFVQRVLLHVKNLLSVQGLSTPRGCRVTSISLFECERITNAAVKAIATNFPSLERRERWTVRGNGHDSFVRDVCAVKAFHGLR